MSQILVDSSMSKPHETNCYKFPNTIRENHLVCSKSTKTKNSSELKNNADSRVNSRPKQNFTRAVSNESAIGRNKVPQQINSSNQSISYKGNLTKIRPNQLLRVKVIFPLMFLSWKSTVDTLEFQKTNFALEERTSQQKKSSPLTKMIAIHILMKIVFTVVVFRPSIMINFNLR